MSNDLLQGLMLVMAAAGMHLITLDSPRLVMCGWVLGFLAQPLFLFSAWTSTPFQWGFFGLALAFVWAWGRGLARHAQQMRAGL
jgi:hypothetical protein